MVNGEIDDKLYQNFVWLAACFNIQPLSKKFHTFTLFSTSHTLITKLGTLIFTLYFLESYLPYYSYIQKINSIGSENYSKNEDEII